LIGVVLAGGRGRRMGGPSKPAQPLAGRTLILYPLAALGSRCERVAVVCKRSTELPALPDGVERWDEPDEPRHPAAGIAHALERARDEVMVCAADMPFVGAAECLALRAAAAGDVDAPAVVARSDGRLEPLFAVYRPRALPSLSEVSGRLTDAVEALSPAVVELPAGVLRSVNTPEELAAAERTLQESGTWPAS
jgi:molybdenum cofactor guanylyltransferase